jgi:hypothetical protein
MADQGSAEVMGRQARDRPPNRVMDCLNCEIAPGAEIAPPLLLLGLGLLPGLGPTAPAIGGGLRARGLCDLLRLQFFYLRFRIRVLDGKILSI